MQQSTDKARDNMQSNWSQSAANGPRLRGYNRAVVLGIDYERTKNADRHKSRTYIPPYAEKRRKVTVKQIQMRRLLIHDYPIHSKIQAFQ